jgi:anti-sigma B factor antagonist
VATDAVQFKTRWHDQVLVLELHGDLVSLAPEDYADVIDHLASMFQDRSNPCVVVDAGRVGKVDSTLVALLVLLWKQMTAHNGRMVLAALDPTFRTVLRYSKLDTVWDIYPSRSEAIATMNNRLDEARGSDDAPTRVANTVSGARAAGRRKGTEGTERRKKEAPD